MKSARCLLSCLCAVAMFCSLMIAQQTSPSAQSAVVPRLVNFSGKATDVQAKAISGVAGATFAIYKEQYDGSPLWLETQNVQADAKGNYTVQLGATKPDGLPLDLFSTGEARWLGVTINGGQEQPRVLLLSVPYALKAADAETVGGLPASAFVLAAPPAGNAVASPPDGKMASSSSSAPTPTSSNVTTTGGTVNALPLWTTSTNIQSSALTQTGSGSSAKMGINTTAPGSTLDVNGTGTVRGNLSLPATGTATKTSGKNSQPTTLTASVFNSTTGTAVAQNFRWQAEPINNDTSMASGSLNLLYGSGSNTIGETGLKVASNGQITFAPGQTYPGGATVTSVGLGAPSSDFTVTGSPVTTSGTLGLNWNIAPTNSNTANAIVKRDATGSFAAGNISAVSLSAANPSGLAIVASTAAPNGAISGTNTNTGQYADGVDGVTSSLYAAGVAGINGNGNGGYGVYGYGYQGVYGLGTAVLGTGVFGVAGNVSSTGAGFGGAVGVHGDSSFSGYLGVGVAGTADDGIAGYFINNSSQGDTPVVIYAGNSASTALLQATNLGTSQGCTIESTGTISCTGSKSAVVPVDGGARKVALYAIEGPENWFEDLGGAQLVDGAAVVHLESTFAQTINTDVDYRVFLTPNGDCKGLYVTNKTANSFEVRELAGGISDISFDYRIIAKRRGYENVRLADKTKLFEAPKRSPRRASDRTTLVKPRAVSMLGVADAPQLPGQ